jgi:hypothetical protein
MIQLSALFQIWLLGALLISFYFFIDVLVFKNKTYSHIFSTWQFPMLLAIFIDTFYHLHFMKK